MRRTARRERLAGRLIVVFAAFIALGCPALLPAAPALASNGLLFGPDVSSYQHPGGAAIDWSEVARDGARFVFIKATQGTGYVNPYFTADWSGAQAAGLVRGAYAFADPALPMSTAAAQAETLVRVVGTTRALGVLPPVLDLEQSGGLSPGQLVQWTRTWLATVASLTGRVPIIYTGAWFWDPALGGNSSFGAYPLWESGYSANPPAVPAGWSQWTFWQHTDDASYPGIATPVDESYLCCGAGTLAGLSDGRTRQIVQLWMRLGGASGQLGLPVAAEVAVRQGWAQVYQRGLIVWTWRFGVHAVSGPIYARLVADGGLRSALGLPTGDAQRLPGGSLLQHFSSGVITYSAATGAHAVWGSFYARWAADGGVASAEGLPTGEQTSASGGSSQQFQNAGLYHFAGQFFDVPGAIRDRYQQLGGPSSPLGWPTSNAKPILGGRMVTFQLGELVEVQAAGRSIVG